MDFAGGHRLSVANTTVGKQFEKIWTHKRKTKTKGMVKRQIDYILVDQVLLNQVTKATVDDTLGVGSDHRTACADILLDSTPRQPRRSEKNGKPDKGWSPSDRDKLRARWADA